MYLDMMLVYPTDMMCTANVYIYIIIYNIYIYLMYICVSLIRYNHELQRWLVMFISCFRNWNGRKKPCFGHTWADSNAAQVESALQLTEQSIRDQNATLEVLLLRCWNLRKIPRAHDQVRESNAAYTEIRILPSCSSTVTHESITSLFCE
jgi:hypothetical protein